MFAEVVEAQTARVTVDATPRLVKAGGILNKLTVTYAVNELASGESAITNNAVSIGLPTIAAIGTQFAKLGTRLYSA